MKLEEIIKALENKEDFLILNSEEKKALLVYINKLENLIYKLYGRIKL